MNKLFPTVVVAALVVACGKKTQERVAEAEAPQGSAEAKPGHAEELLHQLNETVLAQAETIEGLESQLGELNFRLGEVERIIQQPAAEGPKSNEEGSTSNQTEDNPKSGSKQSVGPSMPRGGEATQANSNSKPTSVTLWQAASNGDLEAIEWLSKAEMSLNEKDASGWTPLFWGVAVKNKQVVKLLLAKGAKVNLTNHDGLTPLDWAIQTNSPEIAELLKEHGAKKGNEL